MSNVLTDKQKAFVMEYPVDFNATKAAIRAGYSPTSARQIGSDLLRNEFVKEEISKLVEEIKDSRIVSATENLIHLSDMVRGDEKEEMLFVTKDGEVVKGVRRIIPKDRLKAAELIGKYHGLYVDRHEIDEKINFIVDIEGVDDYVPPTAVERKVKEIEKLAE